MVTSLEDFSRAGEKTPGGVEVGGLSRSDGSDIGAHSLRIDTQFVQFPIGFVVLLRLASYGIGVQHIRITSAFEGGDVPRLLETLEVRHRAVNSKVCGSPRPRNNGDKIVTRG